MTLTRADENEVLEERIMEEALGMLLSLSPIWEELPSLSVIRCDPVTGQGVASHETSTDTTIRK